MRLCVILNPESRLVRDNPGIGDEMRTIVGDAGIVCAPSGFEALAHAVRDLGGAETVAIGGGDGTVHQTITALVRSSGPALPRIALLRGGTNNTIARGLGIRGQPMPLLRNALAGGGRTARRTLLEVDGTRYGFMLSNGLFERYLREYDAGPPSMLRAAWVLARATLSAVLGTAFAKELTAPMPVRVVVDGVAWPDKGFMTVPAGTVDDIGLGFLAFPRAPSALGQFEVLGIGCSAFSLAFQLPRFYRGAGPSHPDIHVALCRELVLQSLGEAVPYRIDGDAYAGGRAITVRPGPIVEFVLP